MLDLLSKLDLDLLIWLNQFHSPFWDELMLLVTGKFIWIPFYLVIIGVFIYLFRRKSIMIILGIIISIAISDQIASTVFKPLTKRLRPCANNEVAIKLYNPEPSYCGGKYGFFSSHAANTFALAMWVILVLHGFTKWSYTIIAWAFFVSYSRIYLIKHYPFDVFVGALCGMFVSYLIYRVMIRINILKLQ